MIHSLHQSSRPEVFFWGRFSKINLIYFIHSSRFFCFHLFQFLIHCISQEICPFHLNCHVCWYKVVHNTLILFNVHRLCVNYNYFILYSGNFCSLFLDQFNQVLKLFVSFVCLPPPLQFC